MCKRKRWWCKLFGHWYMMLPVGEGDALRCVVCWNMPNPGSPET